MSSKTTEKPKYYDIRSDFWQEIFGRSVGYQDYLAQSEAQHSERWVAFTKDIPPLTGEQQARLTGPKRELNVLLYSGIWCGDCVRQGPMIQQIVQACGSHVHLRCIDRDADERLRDELRILGAMRVPILVFLTEDFFEIGRFGDRLLNVYRKKAETEVGAACATGLIPDPADELAAEQAEWVDIFERMLLMARLSPPLRERHGD